MREDPLAELRAEKRLAEKGNRVDDYPADIPTRPVQEALDRLTIALDVLEKCLETLGSRLSPVMYEFMESGDSQPGEAIDDSHSHIVERVTRLRWHVEALTGNVQDYLRRLEV